MISNQPRLHLRAPRLLLIKNLGTVKAWDYEKSRVDTCYQIQTIIVVTLFTQNTPTSKESLKLRIFPAHMCHAIPLKRWWRHHCQSRVDSRPNKSNVILTLFQHRKCSNGSHWKMVSFSKQFSKMPIQPQLLHQCDPHLFYRARSLLLQS